MCMCVCVVCIIYNVQLNVCRNSYFMPFDVCVCFFGFCMPLYQSRHFTDIQLFFTCICIFMSLFKTRISTEKKNKYQETHKIQMERERKKERKTKMKRTERNRFVFFSPSSAAASAAV